MNAYTLNFVYNLNMDYIENIINTALGYVQEHNKYKSQYSDIRWEQATAHSLAEQAYLSNKYSYDLMMLESYMKYYEPLINEQVKKLNSLRDQLQDSYTNLSTAYNKYTDILDKIPSSINELNTSETKLKEALESFDANYEGSKKKVHYDNQQSYYNNISNVISDIEDLNNMISDRMSFIYTLKDHASSYIACLDKGIRNINDNYSPFSG